MKTTELTKLLELFGWSTSKDEVGDRIASLTLVDRRIEAIYGLRSLLNSQKLDFMLSTTTGFFSDACAAIDPGLGSSAPLIVLWNDPDIRAPEILEEHVRQASDEAIAWAQDQDLDKALREYAALPTDAPGARPVWHLASLALLGEVEKLRSYQASFEAGNRLGFVNYVTNDYIDRAVALAEEVTSDYN